MDFALKESDKIKKIAEKLGSSIVIVNPINANDFRELRRKIEKENGLVVVEGGSNEINRAVLENKKVDILLSPEKSRDKDFMKGRDSGLNQILCKLAKNNGIAIGFNFSELLRLSGIDRNKLLGKMMQNAMLCRKYKVNVVVGSFASKWQELRSEKDLEAFARMIGIEKVNNEKVISSKNKKDYIIEGVRLLK